MGFISDLFGSNKGTNFQAQGANIQAPNAIAQQQSFLNALSPQLGITNQENAYNQLGNVSNQFQAVASGQGPNPAQVMLNQATGQNIASQAALQAGQRGAASNVGLIARQAAQQGASTQQQALGQAAIMQANQQLGALGQLGGLAGMQAQIGGQQVGQSQQALNTLANQQFQLQQQQLQNVQQQNQYNAAIAGVNAGAEQGRVSGLIGGVGSALGTVGGSVLGGGSSAAAPINKAHGGKVEPRSSYGRHLAGLSTKVPAMVSPGEEYISPHEVKEVASGHKSPMNAGHMIPGKAEVKGDSLKNDKVPASLEEGGIVIPRSIMQSKNPAAAAAKFIQDTLKKNKKGK